MNEDLKKIANHYGLRRQLWQTVEETAELTQVICKAERYDLDTVRDHLVEEVADVSIMIEQLEYLLGDSRITQIKAEKIERQKRRIEDGKL
jgi:NTP pyrophosphatase (non-canonical NTP hydrolase)